MPLWTVEHLDHSGTVLDTFAPENLRFALNKKPPHTIEYELSLNRDGMYADLVGPYRTDFHLKRGSSTIMKGIHTDFSVNSDDSFCAIAGKDWSHYLELRRFPFDPRPSPAFSPSHVNDYVIGTPPKGLAYQVANGDIKTIVKTLLDVVLARPDSLAITYPTFTTALGITTNYQLPLGDKSQMLSIIEGFSDIDPGFQYEVLSTKELVFYTPQKYNVNVWNTSSLASVQLINDPAVLRVEYANAGPKGTHILGTGSGIGQNTIGTALDAAVSRGVFRRIDMDVDFGELANRTTLINRTKKEFSLGLNPQHEISVTVDPNRITNFWTLAQPGNAIWLDADLTVHRVNSAQEIIRMDCTVSETGEETCAMSLNQIYEVSNPGVAAG